MRSLVKLGAGLAGVMALAMGCGSGSAGPPGPAGANGTNGQNGAPGQNGTNGTNGTNGNSSPSVSAMIPRVGVLDREFDAVIVGNETAFDSTTQVDLGQGVTVSKLTVASPTALFLHVAVDKAAQTGAHDLKLTGASAATVTGMLDVVPAMGVTVSGGTASQGSLAQIDLTDNDSTGFAVNNGNTLFQLQGGIFTLSQCTGCGGGIVYQTPGAGRYIVGFDPLAPGGQPVQPIGINTYFNQTAGQYAALTTFYSDPNAVTVAARTPTTVSLGTPIAGENLAEPLADNVYHVTTDGTTQIAQLIFTNAGGSSLNQLVWALPTTGHFSDFLYTATSCNGPGCNPSVVNVPAGPVATDFYAILMDQSFRGGSTYGYSVTSQKIPATLVAQDTSTSHGTSGTAQQISVTGPTVLTGNVSNSSVAVYTVSGLANAGTCSPLLNWSITAQSDVCFILNTTTFIDQNVSNSQQFNQCQGNALGTGGAHGLSTQTCQQSAGNTWSIAVFQRYQAQVPTGAYTIAFGY